LRRTICGMGSKDNYSTRPASLSSTSLRSSVLTSQRYLLSYPVAKLSGCNANSLRYLNPSLLILLFSRLSFGRVIDAVRNHRTTKENESHNHGNTQNWLKNFNIIAFPPLFFFSALFYTDVASTVFVFLCFQHFLDSQVSRSDSIARSIAQILLGAWALLFRQTNIFWVVVFPAGLAIIQEAAACSKTRSFQQNDRQSFQQVLHNAWINSAVYDPPLTTALFDGQDEKCHNYKHSLTVV